MSVDYGEIVCTAVDQIINARLEGLQYNITKLCLIVDDSQRHKGEYIVSDGNARFQAFSTDKSFRNGNNVLVLIPNGDYNMQKTITGRVAATNTEPFNYTSPMDTMVQISGNVFENKETKGSLLANSPESNKIIQHIITVQGDDLTGLTGFTRLGITAGFRSWLNGLDIVEGTYGLKVYIYSEENHRYDLTFNNNDMYGNPYQFEDYFYQEKVFDISTINNIEKVEVYFYQDGNFKNGNGNNIPYQVNDELLGLQNLEDNLFVNNVAIYFGYDISAFGGETLLLATENSLTYEYVGEKDGKIENPTVDIKLQWIHKVKEREYKVLTQEDIDKNPNYEIRWFRYNEGCKNTDYYAGIGWEPGALMRRPQLLLENVELSSEKPYEEFKVVGIIKEIIDDEEVENVYYSNILRFTNEKYTDESLINKNSGYAIEFEDESKGNYFLYDQNGNILNSGIGQGYRRTAKITYKGGDLINSDDFKIDYIYWYIPKETSSRMDYTMIITSDEYFTENDGDYWNSANYTYKYSKTNWYGTDYIGVKRNNGNVKQSFSIGNHWNQQKANNTIRCIISINGIEYELASELKFGRAGTQGTNTTMILEFVDNENAFIIDNDKCQIECILYDFNGVRLNSNSGTYNWSWLGYDNDNSEKDNKIVNPCFNSFENQSNKIITLEQKDTIRDNLTQNYSILQCIYSNDNEEKLTAYLPIPVKIDKKIELNEENKEEIIKAYSHIEGAKEVIYNHQGIPNYYDDVYKLYETTTTVKKENDKIIDSNSEIDSIPVNWNISNSIAGMKFPHLKELMRAGETYQTLAVEPFYMQSDNKTCVYAMKDGEVVWSQPILIMQSKYDFAMLNNWDGGLTIDENNGTILSTMLGAGRKNNDNTFSGVLIGDIKGGTQLNNTETLTGVYGFDDGAISYALKEDGTATFGKPGNGQIKIDGNSGIIQSSSYSQGSGMKIDLDDGTIDIRAGFYFTPVDLTKDTFEQNKYYYVDNNNYLLAKEFKTGVQYLQKNNSNSSIYISPSINNNESYFSIKSHNGNSLIDIDRTNYYLQSNNYANQIMSGSKLDLSNGSFEARSEKGRVFISGGENDTYFNISIPSNDSDITYSNPLFILDENNYYLKSQSYIENAIIKDSTKKYNTYKQSSSPIVDISEIVAVSKDGTVYKTKGNPPVLGEEYSFQPSSIEEDAPNDKDEKIVIEQTAEQVKQTYLSQLSPNLKSNNVTAGFKLDLKNNLIQGYNLYLSGTNTELKDKPSFIFDSSHSSTPIKVGKKFSIDWDGTLTCNKVNSLNNDDNDNLAISISDNFYVTKNGSAGGSGVNFSGGFGGRFKGTGNFTSAYIDNLYVRDGGTFEPVYTTLLSGVSEVTTEFVDAVTSVSGSITRPQSGTAFSGSATVDGVIGTSQVLVPSTALVSGVDVDTETAKALSYVNIKFSTVTGHFLIAGSETGEAHATAGSVG